MSEVTRILSAIEQGDPRAAEQLLPLVYDELRKLAARKLARETPGQTLQATALVHEAYLRLVGGDPSEATAPAWNSRGHFFAAPAEAMRRILVDQARHKQTAKAGGDWRRIELNDIEPAKALKSVETASQPSRRELAIFQSEAAHLLGISERKPRSSGED
jgi:RNA polymerase sigma factor (TIGR02999 family)